MASMKEARTKVYEISDDTLHPRSRKLIAPQAPLQPDGTVLLYSRETPVATESTLTLHNLGKIRSYENKAEPDNPFLFVNGGYSLEMNKETGFYRFNIHPKLEVDFTWLEELPDTERNDALIYISAMYPYIKVSNTLGKKNSLELEVTIGPKNLSLLSVTPSKTCPGNISNVEIHRREMLDRVQVVGAHVKNLKTSGPHGNEFYKPIAYADIPYPKQSVAILFDEYATHAEQEIPDIQSISSLAQARFFYKKTDPFTQYLG